MSVPDNLRAYEARYFAGLLGLHYVEATPERVVAEIAVRDDLTTLPGIMHGGAIMAFADTLGATATSLNLPPGAGTTTLESKTNFFAPGHTGETLRGECTPLHRGKRTMAWQTRVTAPDGRLVAVITQTQIVLEAQKSPQETLAGMFAGKSFAEQKAMLAGLERVGAATYRAFAEQERDPEKRALLLRAAEKEEENAVTLDQQPG